jgi:hypothetical protein
MMNRTKKLSSLLFAFVAIFAFQRCNEDEIKPAPTVVVTPTSASNIPGGKVTAEITVDAPNGAKSLTIFVAGAEVEQKDISTTDLATPIPYEYTIPAGAVIGATIVVSFQVTDQKDFPSAIANFVVTVGDPVITLQGNLTTQTLIATKPYLLKGQVFIPSGVTLTIPAGTIIKGDKATKATLIVQPGGKLEAIGTETSPIVFTSAQSVGERDRGDWGGILILGNAFVNQASKPAIEGINPAQNYGSTIAEAATPATNATENSGTLKFVRIEYAGVELTPNNETNSLTMGGVGNGTTIEFVQASFGGDDAFEWFGGTVNAKNLVSLSTWDDDFDTDFGWGGNVQFGLVVRNPFYADQSGSNAFESDNQGNANAIAGLCDLNAAGAGSSTGCTRGVFSNITVLGPRDYAGGTPRIISANYQHAAHIRRRSSISIFNSFISGFRLGLRVDDDGTWFNINNGSGVFANNVLSVPANAGTATSATAADGLFVTNIRFAPANDGTVDAVTTAGNATSIANYWNNLNNANGTFNNIVDVAAATNTFTASGVSYNLFWAAQTAPNAAGYPSNPNFSLVAGTAGANNLNDGESFTHAKLSGGFFTTTTYRGAFGSTDWTDGWSEFQPINKAY